MRGKSPGIALRYPVELQTQQVLFFLIHHNRVNSSTECAQANVFGHCMWPLWVRTSIIDQTVTKTVCETTSCKFTGHTGASASWAIQSRKDMAEYMLTDSDISGNIENVPHQPICESFGGFSLLVIPVGELLNQGSMDGLLLRH